MDFVILDILNLCTKKTSRIRLNRIEIRIPAAAPGFMCDNDTDKKITVLLPEPAALDLAC